MALLNRVLGIPIRQEEVDFVIPDIHTDRRLAIDPFLFYRSYSADFRRVHDQLLDFFSYVIDLIKRGDIQAAAEYLVGPEVAEICLGYSKKGTAGSGVGPELAKEIVGLFKTSPVMISRGLRHIEELQLVCCGVGPDRISDITANIIKLFLIEYTERQCAAWDLPIQSGVPISHYFDHFSFTWKDGYFDLPVNPDTGSPLLLVPRRVLRVLPWINYGEYVNEYKSNFLKPVKGKRFLRFKQRKESELKAIEKNEICSFNLKDTVFMDAYVERKEREAAKAEADEIILMKDLKYLRENAERLRKELSAVSPGREDAYAYQNIIHKIFTFCFHPHLVDGKPQQRTYEGTLIRDLIYVNEGTRNFWRYIQGNYGSLHVVVELKNKEQISGIDIDQLATYMGDPLGRFAILVSRGISNKASFNRRKSIYNKDVPRKTILHLSDADIYNLLEIACSMKDTTSYIQNMYRDFMTSIE